MSLLIMPMTFNNNLCIFANFEYLMTFINIFRLTFAQIIHARKDIDATMAVTISPVNARADATDPIVIKFHER